MGAKRKTLLATVGIVLVIAAITAYIATLPSAETHRAPVARVTTPPGAPEDVAAQAQAENSYDSSEKAFGVAARSAHAKDTPAAGFASGSSPAGRGASSEEQDFLAKSNARDLVSQIEACAAGYGGDYTNCGSDRLPDTGLAIGRGRGHVETRSTTASTYVVTATSESGNTFTITKGPNGLTTRSCAGPERAGCGPDATW